jgi:DNA modification methylase
LLTEEEERELNLRLNKNIGQWDYDLLANFDEELLKGIGFESAELDKIFQLDAKPEDDDVPEIRKTDIKLGDMFQLGEHRLLCGDATKREDVEKLMAGEKADMVFTDPPYSVNYGADQDLLNKKSGGTSHLICRPIIGDNLTTQECAEKIWRPAFKNLYEFSQDHCSFYMTMCQGGDQMMMMMMMMMSENWQIKHELIWVKSSPVFSMGRLDYDYQHEPILFGWKIKHNFYGSGQFLKSIWGIPKNSKSELHPTMKPIALIENALLNSSQRDEICLDLFGGSGSTLIACEKLNRKCRMMEIDPIYCQVIIDRWELFTGRKAVKT